MLSLTSTASHQFLYPRISFIHLKLPVFPFVILDINPEISRRNRQRCYFNLVMAKERCSWRFLELRRENYSGSRCCWCNGWDADGDPALEAEILEFMKSSPKPEVFPSKKELLDAGRTDLVEAIRTKGGWLSSGWESDDDIVQDKVVIDFVDEYKSRIAGIQERERVYLKDAEVRFSDIKSVSVNSSQSASPSGRPLEISGEEDSGIEGILYRLERERNLSFGINLGGNVNGTHLYSEDDEDSRHFESSDDIEGREISSEAVLDSSSRSIYDHNSGGELSEFSNGSVKPDMWRAWSNQRAGFSDTEFEAAEICFGEKHLEGKNENSSVAEELGRQEKINHWEIKTRLKQLENELSTTLRLLRSNKDELISKTHDYQRNGNRSNDIQKLSDALEFQENEVINSQGRLRSIRAKLAVLEGRMALAIIEAQKIGEEKQKRINGARTALQLLRTATIVWPNSASQVLLVGSFDGWTSQRKMEKSRTGVFSLSMKLYPGRYEIKFIVDGEWKVDPLRQIVRNDGHENNLFIVT